MREIKFRAWDKIKKEMILHSSFYELQKWNRTEKELEDFELMQYTGLKDKNGKEIYEGDRIKFSGMVSTVVYSAPSFFLDYGSGLYSLGQPISAYGEVIGNIYESPELLTN